MWDMRCAIKQSTVEEEHFGGIVRFYEIIRKKRFEID